MRTDLIRKTALTAAGLAFTGGAIAGPVTAAYAAPTRKPATQTQTDRKPPGERELGVRYEAQPNFYYCGPAATRNALSVQGKNIRRRRHGQGDGHHRGRHQLASTTSPRC